MATIQQGSEQNKLGKPDGVAQYSKFDLSKHIYTTQRYGEQQILGAYNAITGDKWKIRNAHELQTYTLSAPLMTPIYIEKDYFQVPRQAILPFNWEKINKQPNIGEDIDPTIIGTSIPKEYWNSFLQKLDTAFATASTTFRDNQTELGIMASQVANAFRLLIIHEYIYSYGSLLNCLGCKMAGLWLQNNVAEDIKAENFDNAMELLLAKIQYGFTIGYTNEDGSLTQYTVDIALAKKVGENNLSLNEALNKMRDDPSFQIVNVYISATQASQTAAEFYQGFNLFMTKTVSVRNARRNYGHPVDLARVWAYQLVNAEYFTNDKVDYIYSAELYRQYIGSLIVDNQGVQYIGTFVWNGVNYQYDYLSAYYFKYLAIDNLMNIEALAYLSALFSYRRSLKYLDYFVGAKTRPLGVGDVTVNPDAQGRVNVIDITKNIQKQRFLNAVQRIGRKSEDYAKEMFGIDMKWDYHTPLWLGSTRDAIRSRDTENTGEAQINAINATTSKLESFGGNFEFEFEIDRDSIIIGLAFYDIERSYAKGVHRTFMHVDRYDMFNSYMQYTGDQPIYTAEYDAGKTNGTEMVFGYVPAYEEFKQEYNEANGGFVTALPGYTFIDGMERKDRKIFTPTKLHQSPDFIRCKSTELDRFYNSLTGHSLANYFHFIIDFYNEVSCTRPMSFNPSIL